MARTMTSKHDGYTIDVAGKFLLGLFAFLALAACVTVLGGCSSADSGGASKCGPGRHVVQLRSTGEEACGVDGQPPPCLNGLDCVTGCCVSFGTFDARQCAETSSPVSGGFCVCGGAVVPGICPAGTTCQEAPFMPEADGGNAGVYAMCLAG
jgi:hypothetical protein